MRKCLKCGRTMFAFPDAKKGDGVICIGCKTIHYELGGGRVMLAPEFEKYAPDVSRAISEINRLIEAHA